MKRAQDLGHARLRVDGPRAAATFIAFARVRAREKIDVVARGGGEIAAIRVYSLTGMARTMFVFLALFFLSLFLFLRVINLLTVRPRRGTPLRECTQ